VKTPQTTKAFYGQNQERAPDSWLLSNFAKHSPYEYKIPFGKFAGKFVDIPFSERAIMLAKASLMGDEAIFAKILKAADQPSTKELGRQVSPWNEKLWQTYVCAIAYDVVLAKFRAVPEANEMLLNVTEDYIVEASPRDRHWGVGMGAKNEDISIPSAWKGSNILGWALMEARQELRNIKKKEGIDLKDD
jgi:ribA/ribD-fused uncharacterized protein